jgi:hypothetical protein
MKSGDFLPLLQGQTLKFTVHISYCLQNCKKNQTLEKDLPFLKNDITTISRL